MQSTCLVINLLIQPRDVFGSCQIAKMMPWRGLSGNQLEECTGSPRETSSQQSSGNMFLQPAAANPENRRIHVWDKDNIKEYKLFQRHMRVLLFLFDFIKWIQQVCAPPSRQNTVNDRDDAELVEASLRCSDFRQWMLIARRFKKSACVLRLFIGMTSRMSHCFKAFSIEILKAHELSIWVC